MLDFAHLFYHDLSGKIIAQNVGPLFQSLKGSVMRLKIVIISCLALFFALIASQSFALDLEVVAQLDSGPGNITVTPDKRIILSLHPFYSVNDRVVELRKDGKLVPFPNKSWNQGKTKNSGTAFDSVLGIQCDTNGVVWMLDTGLRNLSDQKLVGWDTFNNRLHKVINLIPPKSETRIALPETAFLNDLAVDPNNRVCYLSHSGGVKNSAIVVVDLETGTTRYVLQGHKSVQPEDTPLVMEHRKLDFTLPDSGKLAILIGVNPIALDSSNEWLYYGPMNGKSMYRVRTADLRNPRLSSSELADKVERYSDKPICDGISIDDGGNIYISDLEANAIGVITPDRQYKKLIEDERISWPESFSFGPDGYLYFVASQLHRSAPLNNGKETARPPFYVFRIKPLSPGVVGR